MLFQGNCIYNRETTLQLTLKLYIITTYYNNINNMPTNAVIEVVLRELLPTFMQWKKQPFKCVYRIQQKLYCKYI